MKDRSLVRMAHPGIEGTALVPATALQQPGSKWSRVADDESPAPANPTTRRRRTTKTSAAKKAPAKQQPGKRAEPTKEK